jgi:glycosyltransferase involved in cell wall biosynthesis
MLDKNLLVISYYFPPMGLSGVQRTSKFVKYLPDNGWNTFVLTSNPTSYYAYDDSLMVELEREGIQIFRTDSNSKRNQKKEKKTVKFPSYFKQKLGRAILQTIYIPDSKIRWRKAAIELGEKIIKENNINAIFATAPPFTDFIIANELSQKFGKPFVVDYRDTWIDNPFHFYPTPFHKNHNIKLESDILIHSSKAFVTTRYSKELLLKRYRFLSHNDVVILSHGYDPEDFNHLDGINKDRNKFIITHSGLFQDNRTPKYFLSALASFLDKEPEARNKIEARFIGLMRPNHLNLIKKYKLENVASCTGYLPHKDTVKSVLESDVLWLMLDDTIRSPGKLYEYFAARKPLLVCAPDGIIRRTALESKASIATEPKDKKAIEKAIMEYYHLWKSQKLPSPDEAFISQFDRSKITAELARELALIAEF